MASLGIKKKDHEKFKSLQIARQIFYLKFNFNLTIFYSEVFLFVSMRKNDFFVRCSFVSILEKFYFFGDGSMRLD